MKNQTAAKYLKKMAKFDELAASYTNGNRNYVMEQVIKMSKKDIFLFLYRCNCNETIEYNESILLALKYRSNK